MGRNKFPRKGIRKGILEDSRVSRGGPRRAEGGRGRDRRYLPSRLIYYWTGVGGWCIVLMPSCQAALPYHASCPGLPPAAEPLPLPDHLYPGSAGQTRGSLPWSKMQPHGPGILEDASV